MKNKSLVLGLSTLGLAVTINSYALNVVDLSREVSSDINISAAPVNSFVGKTDTSRKMSYQNQNYNLQVLSEQTDKFGKVHTRMAQTYNDIPVYGRQVIVHKAKSKNGFSFSNKNLNKFTGQLITDLQNDLIGVQPAAGFDEQQALNMAKNLHNQNKGIKGSTKLVYENEYSQLMVYTHSKDDKAKLVYKVSFFVDDIDGTMPARPTYLIDASTKEVIKSWNALMHNNAETNIGIGVGGNEKVGQHEYGKDGIPKLNLRAAPRGECFMTNSKVRTVDLKNGYFGAKTHHFPCDQPNTDTVNGAFSPLNDAHFFGEQVFNMYREWYDKAPLTFKLVMRVHYGSGYENAFWNGSSMTFGDGLSYFYPLVAMDVVGHEVSHGYTEQNSDLEYMGQSGGINESFSDMAGKASEYFTFGKYTWGIGDSITKGKEPLRYMDEPAKDGTSIDDARNYYGALDVHYSSGVFNKAFYLLATTSNWDIKQAFDVFVHANTYYWVPKTDFTNGALGAVYAAEDLGYEVSDVIKTFEAVGIACKGDSCSVMPKKPKDEPKDPPKDEPKPKDPETDNESDNDSDMDDSDWENEVKKV